MFEQTFKNIDNTLRTEAGCQNELDYIEQTSWIIFLKYLDDLRGGPGFSDTGVSGFLPGQYSSRRAENHEEAKT